MGWRLGGAVVLLAGLAGPRVSEACSLPSQPGFALPATGASGVSTGSSLIIVAQHAQPGHLSLTAGGVAVPLDGVELMGTGITGSYEAPVSYWRVRGPALLQPGTEYVLRGEVLTHYGDVNAVADVELTRFTTGPGYDKTPGAPAVIRGVRLWRVRYPAREIASGNCVFAEYHAFVSLDWDPGTVPGTPDDALVHAIAIRPRVGGAGHAILTYGSHFTGRAPEAGHPMPDLRVGFDLDPTQEHCVQVTTMGYDPSVRLPVASNVVCASVTSLDASTVEADGGAGVRAGDAGGCEVGGGGGGGWLVVWLLTMIESAGDAGRSRRRHRAPPRRG